MVGGFIVNESSGANVISKHYNKKLNKDLFSENIVVESIYGYQTQ